jgi:quercetin dioxygenase-like cupin family protein
MYSRANCKKNTGFAISNTIFTFVESQPMKRVLRELPRYENSSFIIKEEIAAQFAAPFHFHKGYELTYIVKGQGKFYGGDNLLNFVEGDLYLFGIGFPHYFINEKSFF